MVEKIGHIKNPLTVIAIFAGIAEISGTVVLPFIAPAIQSTYVWFLMGFPVFLVGLFFYTLLKKPTALYSPSDYKDEQNFVTAVRNATPDELNRKILQDVKEVEADLIQGTVPSATEHPEGPKTSPTTADKDATVKPATTVEPSGAVATEKKDDTLHTVKEAFRRGAHSAVHQRVLGDLALAEKLALSRLSKSLNLTFRLNALVTVPGERGVTFDAFAHGNDIAHGVDVKFFPTATIDIGRLYDVILKAKKASDALRARGTDTFLLHLFIVSDADREQLSYVRKKLVDFASAEGVYIQIHVATMTDLANDYQLGQ